MGVEVKVAIVTVAIGPQAQGLWVRKSGSMVGVKV